MRWKRWLGIGGILAAVGLLVAYGFRPEPVPVEVSKAGKGSLRVTVEEEGKTRVTDRYIVSAPVAGIARRISLEVGDPVRQGQVVCVLEPRRAEVLDSRTRAEAEARVAAAAATMQAARERLKAAAVDAEYWQKELERMKRLKESGDIAGDRYDKTAADYDRAEAARRSAQHDVEAAASELEAARASLNISAASPPPRNSGELVSVTAPSAGRVLRVIHKSEGAVNAGEPLLEVANARFLEIEVEVLSTDAVKISPGTKVLLERWGGEKPLEGAVRLIEPTAFTKISALGVEEQRVRVIADITSPPQEWSRLGDGYRVEASFILWEGSDILQVPASALFRYQDKWAVFLVEGDKAVRRIVEVGHRNGLAAEITSGLQGGETIVTHPDDTIDDGKLVVPRQS